MSARGPASPVATQPSRSSFSTDELNGRSERLAKVFRMFDANGDGVLDEKEVEFVARAFNPEKFDKDDVGVIMTKLDPRQSGVVDEEDWVGALIGMFQFMSGPAFEKHINELCLALERCKSMPEWAALTSAPAHPKANNAH